MRLFVLSVVFGFVSGIVGGMVVNSTFFDNWLWGEGAAWKPLVTQSTARQDTKQLTHDNLMRKGLSIIIEIYLASDAGKDGLFLPSQKIASGLFLTSNGYLATDKRIFGQYNRKDLVVVDQDKKVYPISKVISDPISDLAIIKIDGDNFSSSPFMSEDDFNADMDIYLPIPEVGLYATKVLSVNTLIPQTKSDYYFNSETIYRFGLLKNGFEKSSIGAPLINFKGELVGMMAGQSVNGGGFDKFIKVGVIQSALNRILDKGTLARAYLGLYYQEAELNNSLQNKLKSGIVLVNDPYHNVNALDKKSPLINFGLKANDVILEADGESLTNWHSLPEVLLDYKPGDKIKIKYLQDNNEKTIMVELGSK